jgi:hypothetical protein
MNVAWAAILDVVKWDDALEHYEARMRVHRNLLFLQRDKKVIEFAKLLLGISDNQGNYSARDHGLGPKILSENSNAAKNLFLLGAKLQALKNANDVPKIIRDAQMKYFKIGVGSEASCMLNPQVCWIANTRSIWTHLVFKHEGNFSRANEELNLYRDEDETSEMAYRKWAAIHRAMRANLTEIAEQGSLLAKEASVKPGEVKYLWADAIANALYSSHHQE